MQVVSVLGAPTMSVSSASLVLQGVLYTQHARVSPGVISQIEEPPGALFLSLCLYSHFLRLEQVLEVIIFIHFGDKSLHF